MIFSNIALAEVEGLAAQPDMDHRSHSRSNVFLSASLMLGAVSLAVRVRNLSQSGAPLDGASLPPPGTQIRLVRGNLCAEGEVAWQTGGQAGVRFNGTIDVAAWVKKIGHSGQQRVDEAIAALRGKARPSQGAPVHPTSLAQLSRDLDAICERLATSSVMTVEFGEELVKLDALAQNLRQLAKG